ncbi:MAG TPA: caspase family protein [Acidimicrobiia bacterium]|nr:caspase family protein [Acidimicrobiia bacterium]
MASSGGVGAVRRRRRSRSRTRTTLSFVAVLVLFASGAGNSAPGYAAASLGNQFLSALRLDRTGEEASPAVATPDTTVATGATPAAESVPSTVPVTAPPAAPAVATAFDHPIVAPPSFSRSRGVTVRSTRTAYASGPRDGGVWAVIVGIDDYPGTDADLKAAVADARDVDSALAAYNVPATHRLVLLDGQATGDNIRGALAWLTNRAAPESTAVFFYSGHVRQVAGDPDHDGEYVDEAIVAADGDNVYDGQVADILRGLQARTAWLGIAACYGGGFDDALAPGRVLTAAAGENEVAYENSSLGHSYLVEYMIRRAMLQGKAPGSVQDSFAWAKAQIARDYPNRMPVIIDRTRGPVVLGRAVTAPPEHKPPAPPPSQSKDPQPSPSAPSPTAPQPKPGDNPCANVLGVTVCSQQHSSEPYLRVGPARPAEPGF